MTVASRLEAPIPVPEGAADSGLRQVKSDTDFRAAVARHVRNTCAKEIRDASPLDFYNAFAHTVRDRLVHRWLATQRTHRANSGRFI